MVTGIRDHRALPATRLRSLYGGALVAVSVARRRHEHGLAFLGVLLGARELGEAWLVASRQAVTFAVVVDSCHVATMAALLSRRPPRWRIAAATAAADAGLAAATVLEEQRLRRRRRWPSRRRRSPRSAPRRR